MPIRKPPFRSGLVSDDYRLRRFLKSNLPNPSLDLSAQPLQALGSFGSAVLTRRNVLRTAPSLPAEAIRDWPGAKG